ncbi:HVO_2922 family protein [Halobaculum lipolyticum]|uniref:HVO_2922 family protein n=1 Tax=Halobaculum lipolyticum TaxID=3032001 RepID=A0ABD5WHT0_9EURY|nr:HVO_2922 family protein [Halobaculum sp. DT31]
MSSKATFEVYRDRVDEWRWRLVHDNGNVIADSGEGYASKQKAREGIRSVKSNAPEADVVDVQG